MESFTRMIPSTSEMALAIAAHSAEFGAANQLLNKGSKLADLVLATPVFLWPEDGPTP